MKNISSYLCALFLAGFFAAEAEALTYSDSPSWYTGLIGKSQNQILEPKPLGDISRLPKLAKVHFIVDSSDKLGFDNITAVRPWALTRPAPAAQIKGCRATALMTIHIMTSAAT